MFCHSIFSDEITQSLIILSKLLKKNIVSITKQIKSE